MKRYTNLSGESGVSAYETGPDFIIVQFSSGDAYLYNYLSAGKGAIELMKHYAIQGKGLSAFISRSVKSNYASKLN